ncbi:MAG: hypothetical protein VW397_06095 [Candidatus Margulisiibacteriota bacterium]
MNFNLLNISHQAIVKKTKQGSDQLSSSVELGVSSSGKKLICKVFNLDSGKNALNQALLNIINEAKIPNLTIKNSQDECHVLDQVGQYIYNRQIEDYPSQLLTNNEVTMLQNLYIVLKVSLSIHRDSSNRVSFKCFSEFERHDRFSYKNMAENPLTKIEANRLGKDETSWTSFLKDCLAYDVILKNEHSESPKHQIADVFKSLTKNITPNEHKNLLQKFNKNQSIETEFDEFLKSKATKSNNHQPRISLTGNLTSDSANFPPDDTDNEDGYSDRSVSPQAPEAGEFQPIQFKGAEFGLRNTKKVNSLDGGHANPDHTDCESDDEQATVNLNNTQIASRDITKNLEAIQSKPVNSNVVSIDLEVYKKNLVIQFSRIPMKEMLYEDFKKNPGKQNEIDKHLKSFAAAILDNIRDESIQIQLIDDFFDSNTSILKKKEMLVFYLKSKEYFKPPKSGSKGEGASALGSQPNTSDKKGDLIAEISQTVKKVELPRPKALSLDELANLNPKEMINQIKQGDKQIDTILKEVKSSLSGLKGEAQRKFREMERVLESEIEQRMPMSIIIDRYKSGDDLTSYLSQKKVKDRENLLTEIDKQRNGIISSEVMPKLSEIEELNKGLNNQDETQDASFENIDAQLNELYKSQIKAMWKPKYSVMENTHKPLNYQEKIEVLSTINSNLEAFILNKQKKEKFLKLNEIKEKVNDYENKLVHDQLVENLDVLVQKNKVSKHIIEFLEWLSKEYSPEKIEDLKIENKNHFEQRFNSYKTDVLAPLQKFEKNSLDKILSLTEGFYNNFENILQILKKVKSPELMKRFSSCVEIIKTLNLTEKKIKEIRGTPLIAKPKKSSVELTKGQGPIKVMKQILENSVKEKLNAGDKESQNALLRLNKTLINIEKSIQFIGDEIKIDFKRVPEDERDTYLVGLLDILSSFPLDEAAKSSQVPFQKEISLAEFLVIIKQGAINYLEELQPLVIEKATLIIEKKNENDLNFLIEDIKEYQKQLIALSLTLKEMSQDEALTKKIDDLKTSFRAKQIEFNKVIYQIRLYDNVEVATKTLRESKDLQIKSNSELPFTLLEIMNSLKKFLEINQIQDSFHEIMKSKQWVDGITELATGNDGPFIVDNLILSWMVTLKKDFPTQAITGFFDSIKLEPKGKPKASAYSMLKERIEQVQENYFKFDQLSEQFQADLREAYPEETAELDQFKGVFKVSDFKGFLKVITQLLKLLAIENWEPALIRHINQTHQLTKVVPSESELKNRAAPLIKKREEEESNKTVAPADNISPPRVSLGLLAGIKAGANKFSQQESAVKMRPRANPDLLAGIKGGANKFSPQESKAGKPPSFLDEIKRRNI